MIEKKGFEEEKLEDKKKETRGKEKFIMHIERKEGIKTKERHKQTNFLIGYQETMSERLKVIQRWKDIKITTYYSIYVLNIFPSFSFEMFMY